MRIKPFFCLPVLCLLAYILPVTAQDNTVGPDHVYYNNIKSVKLNQAGDQLSYPMITLGGGDKLELSFDDLDNDVKNYYYTFVLCNADWTPAQINQMEYLRGFSENRIQDYRFSSIALQKYTHYSVQLPSQNGYPIKSGNYLLKVYLDSDTSQLVLTRRMLIIGNKAGVSGFIQQPVTPKLFKTHQKINFSVNTAGLNIVNPFDQLKVVILQNYRWDNAIKYPRPLFIKGNTIDYNWEVDCVMPAGKEWRWIDLRSFRLQTERVKHTDYRKDGTDVYAMPDYERGSKLYQYIKDINGLYYLATIDDYNPFYEGDYATVHFNFPVQEPYAGYDMYILGELTNYEITENNKLSFNPATRAYEGSLYLKQGFYNYEYALVDKTVEGSLPSTEYTEGNSWEAENNYTILVYYRSLGGRSDELVATVTLNSMLSRK
ncbi:protein of unknown function [Chitinophaga sp. CF118]|uniref:type IX secretion system plug protein n=1 Tax=Chitinophaga sp. CF118 TaxID=1884367 RepID=UPI0008EF5E9F|nr:DUF5103 domain-containing protein [Chitinophaga sp. CF118]SFE95754.1 protein of unknown function [Chitinophaga sp. CF118]